MMLRLPASKHSHGDGSGQKLQKVKHLNLVEDDLGHKSMFLSLLFIIMNNNVSSANF